MVNEQYEKPDVLDLLNSDRNEIAKITSNLMKMRS
jgi:hypothetical protein